MILEPKTGSTAQHSLSYTGVVKQAWLDAPIGDDMQIMFEAMPDHVDLSIPFKP